MAARRERFRLLVVGVGGQGVLTAARCLGDAAMLSGRDVVIGQLHGMSQRGGSVEATVLVGPGRSSFISDRCADVVLGLEPLEVLRARPKMHHRTHVIVHAGRVVPPSLAKQGEGYPPLADVMARIRAVAPDVFEIADSVAAPGDPEPCPVNIVALGVLAALELLPFGERPLRLAIERRCPARLADTNRRAFERGRALVNGSQRTQAES